MAVDLTTSVYCGYANGLFSYVLPKLRRALRQEQRYLKGDLS